MSALDVNTDSATEIRDTTGIAMRLEVMALPVADVDRAKRF